MWYLSFCFTPAPFSAHFACGAGNKIASKSSRSVPDCLKDWGRFKKQDCGCKSSTFHILVSCNVFENPFEMQDKYKYRFSFQHLVSHQCLLIWEFTARPTSQEDRLLITGALQKMIFTTGRPEPTGNLCRTNCPKCFPTEEVLRGRWRRLLSPSWQQLKPVRLASGTFDFIHLNHLAARAESDFIHLNHDLLPSNIPVSAWVCMSSASARQHLWTRDTTFGTDLTSYSHCWNQQTNNETQKPMHKWS